MLHDGKIRPQNWLYEITNREMGRIHPEYSFLINKYLRDPA